MYRNGKVSDLRNSKKKSEKAEVMTRLWRKSTVFGAPSSTGNALAHSKDRGTWRQLLGFAKKKKKSGEEKSHPPFLDLVGAGAGLWL
jgi:hypothetical protein